ncbi:MAG: helix-turn-helix domain-containing protein [Acidimicrobiales bacterium]
MSGTRKQVLALRASDRARLTVLAKSPSLPYRTVVQAKAVLYAADGLSTDEIAHRCDTTTNTVRRWVRRFDQEGVEGIGRVSEGRGRPPEVSPERVQAIVEDTLGLSPPDGGTRWSSRAMAERHGVSKDYVLKVWRSHGIDTATGRSGPRPSHRYFGSIEEVGGGQLDANAIGLLAALNEATGDALAHCRPNSDHRDFMFFLKLVEAIELWVQHWNDTARPFSWHSQAEAVAKAQRGKAALERYIKSTTDG